MGPLASFRHPYCYQLVITSHFCVRKPNTSKADAHDPPPVASSLSGFQITVLPPQSPVPSLEAQLTCFPIMGRGGGGFDFLIDCSPATLMELAFAAGSLWSLPHQMHLYLVTAGTQGQLLRHFQHRPSPAESLTGDSASLSSRRGQSMNHL